MKEQSSRLRGIARTLAVVALFAVHIPGSHAQAASEPHPAEALLDRAKERVRTDPNASSRDLQAALELLAIRPNADLEVEARTLLCDHLSERDRPAAEAQIAQARALLPQTKRPGLRAGVLGCEGTILETTGDNLAAGKKYDEAVTVAAAAQDDELLAGALFSRGYLLGLQGQYASGLMDLKRSQAVYEQIDLPDHALTALNGIAILYTRMGDYDQSRQIYERALQAQRAAGLRREQGVTLHNLGRAHENLHEWAAARAAFQESYEISRELNYPRGEAYALRGLAAVMNASGDHRGALATLDRAQALQQQTPDARLNAQIQLARGVALHQIKHLPASIQALQEALRVFKEAESLHELRATYAELAAVEAELGDWRDAYAYEVAAQRTAEQMFRNQIDQRFATLRVEFDTAAKEKENALLLRENQANQKALQQERRARGLQAIVILLTVVLAGLLATLAVHQWRTTHRMRTLAMTDELTGVPNRRSVLNQLEPLLAANASCAMLIIDIDHFKSINDQHGHPEGDEALKLVAACLRENVRPPGFVGRLGGEEFVAVLPHLTTHDAMQAAERLRECITAVQGREWMSSRRITVSVGLTMSKPAGDTPSTMLQRADSALYEAKHGGRNCVRARLPAVEESPRPTQQGPSGAPVQAEFA